MIILNLIAWFIAAVGLLAVLAVVIILAMFLYYVCLMMLLGEYRADEVVGQLRQRINDRYLKGL